MRMLFLFVISLSMLAHTCFAQDKKAEKDSARRLQQRLRQLEQEKTQLTREKEEASQEKAATETQLKEARGRLGAIQRKAGEEAARAATLARELESANADGKSVSQKLAEIEKQFESTSAKLAATENERRRLEAIGLKQQDTIAIQNRVITTLRTTTSVCESNNGKLFQYGTEVLERYQRKSCSDALLQAEPLTGLKRVEIENLVEEYREKFGDQRLPARTSPELRLPDSDSEFFKLEGRRPAPATQK